MPGVGEQRPPERAASCDPATFTANAKRNTHSPRDYLSMPLRVVR
jgi:hypothetical protein